MSRKHVPTKAEIAHNTRCQFNHGYHDAIWTVRKGHNTPERNFGFGPALIIAEPRDVITEHFSAAYATGWTHGYYEAIAGPTPETSEEAWQTALERGFFSGCR